MEPRAEYQARKDARQAVVERLGRRDRALSRVRAAVFLLGGAAVWFGLPPGRAILGALVGASFVALVIAHDRALQARRRAERSVAFYDRALERLDGKWAGRSGERGERFIDPQHPYARDLDLFGKGSLYELLCSARTHGGQQTLADWLRAPAQPAEIRARQLAVDELRGRIDLREDLAVLGADAQAQLNPEGLAAWGAEKPPRDLGLAWVMPPIAAAATAALVWWSMGRGYWPFACALVALELARRGMTERLDKLRRAVEKPGHDLGALAAIFARLEREPAVSPRLTALKVGLAESGVPASRDIARLGRLVNLFLQQRNVFFLPFAFVLLWAPQLALAIDRWRARSGPSIARWLAAVGQLEALCALAGYAFEHPEHPFPELADDGPLYDGEAIGHPLLPAATCVRNDLRLDGELRLLMVSGSNMSGKSTLLRSVGVNAVLAFAGAPVCAKRLRLSVLQLGATLRIEDSLAEGASRFYAEITRLRTLVDLAERGPLLFLLDEILAGTNSHDRRVGAEALVRGLVERGAVGLVTTHDLALADVADSFGARAVNVHFEDHLEGGQLVFDYRMRPGVVRKSNALELMRAVGLKV